MSTTYIKKSNLKLDLNDRDYKPTKLVKNLLPNWLGFWDRVHQGVKLIARNRSPYLEVNSVTNFVM